MRVTALKAALKKSSGQAAAAQLHDALESRGRSKRGYAMRERRLAPGAMAEDALGEIFLLLLLLALCCSPFCFATAAVCIMCCILSCC